ncbi:MAG TPA: ABC transporter permease subunit [Anaerolineaceae bacterium]|nr:ABC transporter permease subunit [Anaerolineaceae bacterium]
MAWWTIARLTFREAARRKILWAALGLGVVFLVVYGVGYNLILQDVHEFGRSNNPLVRSEVSSFFMMAGLYAVNFLTVMMTVLTSVDTLSGEIASGTIHTLVSKPVRRWEVLAGKWLGYSILLMLYLVLMAGGVVAIVYALSGYQPPHLARGLILMLMNSLLLLSVSLLGGTTLSTLANGVMVFGLYGIAFVGGWVEQMGALLQNASAVNVGVVSSLILPSEALWRRAVYEMQSAGAGMLGGMTPFSAVSVPSPMMIVYAVIYLLVVLGLAFRRFQTRDF